MLQKTKTESKIIMPSLQRLPILPTTFHLPQCISYQNELLICGGFDNNKCYSYHVVKQQYKLICSYPTDVALNGHAVVSYSVDIYKDKYYYENNNGSEDSEGNGNHDNNNNNCDGIMILSFGGFRTSNTPYHTLYMKYKSIWDEQNEIRNDNNNNNNDNNNNNNNSNNNNNNNNNDNNNNNNDNNDQINEKISTPHINQWTTLPDQVQFGERQGHDFRGVRALVGGSRRHLLFITHSSNSIDVVDLKSFQYIEHLNDSRHLPIAGWGTIGYHCFVAVDNNEFVLMFQGEPLLIRYDEINREFFYRTLSVCSSLRYSDCYAYTYWNQYIFIFGGYIYNWNHQKALDGIWIFDMKEKNWVESTSKYEAKMPFPIYGAAAVVNDDDLSIHIIGGRNDKHQEQVTHFIKLGYSIEKVRNISEYWIRTTGVSRLGWIKEFDSIVFECLDF